MNEIFHLLANDCSCNENEGWIKFYNFKLMTSIRT